MRPISFRVFAIIYFGIIGWFVTASLLQFEGYYFLAFFAISIMGVLESAGCLFLALKIAELHPIAQADVSEIEREDDVLLQGITFISAILFFYVNTLASDVNIKFWVSVMIILSTGSFYLLRALAKIKSDSNLRFYSAFLMVWVASSYVFEFLVFFLPIIFPPVLNLPPLGQVMTVISFAVIPFFLSALAGVYLPRRYGIKPLLWRTKDKEGKSHNT